MLRFGLGAAALSGPVAVRHRIGLPLGPCTAASCPPLRIVRPPSAWGMPGRCAGPLERSNALRSCIVGIAIAVNAPMLVAVKRIPRSRRLPSAGVELSERSPFPDGRSRSSWNGSARRGECGWFASNCSFAISTATTIRWWGNRPFARLRLQWARQPRKICADRRGWSGQGVPAAFRRAATVAAVTRRPALTGEWTWPTT